MRYRFLLLACWMLVTASHAESSLKILPRPVDEIIVNRMMEPVGPSDLEVLILLQPGQCQNASDRRGPDQTVTARIFSCAAFLKAEADGKATLPLHVQQLTSMPASEEAVLASAKPVLSGRRYVAMIIWDVDFRIQRSTHCDPCSFLLDVPMEIVVMDTSKNEKIWQSHHVSQVTYTGRHFDAKAARMLGLNGMQRLVNVILSQRQVLAAESAGLQRVKGFQMTEGTRSTPPLNPDARLIIVNNDHFNDISVEKRYTVLLSSLSQQPPVKALYTIPLHGFVALKLPAGKYALQVSKETTQQFDIGSAPVYLMVKSPQWDDRQELRAMSTEELSSLSPDLVNALIPELTPASYQSKGHGLYWSKP